MRNKILRLSILLFLLCFTTGGFAAPFTVGPIHPIDASAIRKNCRKVDLVTPYGQGAWGSRVALH